MVIRYEPGEEAAFLSELDGELASGAPSSSLAKLLLEGGEDVVIVWGERLAAEALPALLAIARTLGLAEHEGAGLLEIPAFANGRGLREVGCLPFAGPGYSESAGGRSAAQIAQAAADGDITALYLFETDPLRDQPDAELWNRGLAKAGLVVAHASVLTEGLREHANVIFPADSYAEKEGTVVHPDGRLQRLRTAIGHPTTSGPGGGRSPRWPSAVALTRACSPAPWPSSRWWRRCRSTRVSRSKRSAGGACAGPSARRPRGCRRRVMWEERHQ